MGGVAANIRGMRKGDEVLHRGRRHDTWWRQTAPSSQLRDTIENILVADRAR